nr:MAG TPA: hypothetical protein [Caudoviricetes sp.]
MFSAPKSLLYTGPYYSDMESDFFLGIRRAAPPRCWKQCCCWHYRCC